MLGVVLGLLYTAGFFGTAQVVADRDFDDSASRAVFEILAVMFWPMYWIGRLHTEVTDRLMLPPGDAP
jgi:hypothetical protein